LGRIVLSIGRKGGDPNMALKLRLENKVAIVTGAGSRAAGIGNGRAAAILFAREGAKVLIVDNTLAAAEETLAAIKKERGEAEVFIGDVTKASDCRAMVEQAVRRWGRLDVLDNNVGIEGPGSVLSVTEEYWDQVMTVNVKSMMLTGKYAVPAMVTGGGGSIITISSISALRPRGLTAYSTSKGAVIALSRAMAMDHAKDGVRVNCIAPGPVYTPMVYSGGMTEEVRERRRRAAPLGIEGTGWDIGYAALYLASDEARYVTGIVLVVDGGVTIASPSRGYESTP
jgi:NAD(P)-dependent dehydrogenase (short-subunit alcohol dehydrogenase family)